MEKNPDYAKLQLEIEGLKTQLKNIHEQKISAKKSGINWAIFIPVITAVIGGILTILASLYNSWTSIDLKRIDQEITIIEKALEAETIEESRQLLIFYTRMGLLNSVENLEKKIKDSTITLPPPRSKSQLKNQENLQAKLREQ